MQRQGACDVLGSIVVAGQDFEEELGRPVWSLAHQGFYRFPFVGRLLQRSGAVVGHPENAQRLLAEDGQLVLVFPEGQKGPVKPPSERYQLQRFGRWGFVETALRVERLGRAEDFAAATEAIPELDVHVEAMLRTLEAWI